MSQLRTLVIMRHAHADAGQVEDHARELSVRGRGEATRAGAWMKAQGLAVDLLLHSDALRTTQTAELAAAELGAAPSRHAMRELYLASPERVFKACASQAADEVRCLTIVAHNPGLAELAMRLARRGGSGGVELVAFAPATVAVFEFSGAWTELSGAETRLVAHFRP